MIAPLLWPVGFVAFAMLHPVHETVAEVEWNDETRRMEVALRLDVLDEQWIRRHHAEPDEDEGDAAWRLRYLRDRFRFLDPWAESRGNDLAVVAEGSSQPVARNTDRQRPLMRYRWVGREQQAGHVWWFFEVQPESGRRPMGIEQRMLFDRDDRYTHRVLLLGTEPPVTRVVTPDRPQSRLNAE